MLGCSSFRCSILWFGSHASPSGLARAHSAGTPTGTVTFQDGGATLGTASLTGGSATFSTSTLAPGAHSVTASYGGDGSFLTSTAATFTQYVDTNLTSYPKLATGAYNLGNTNLSGGYFGDLSLAGANMSNSNFKNGNFFDANLTGANLTDANLTGATGLASATLTNVVWASTQCPDGTDSDNDGGTCASHL